MDLALFQMPGSLDTCNINQKTAISGSQQCFQS